MKWNVRHAALAAVGWLAAASPGFGQPPGHGAHPPMPDQQFVLHGRLERAAGGEPITVETLIQLPSPLSPAELDQSVSMPQGGPSLRIKRYLPKAALEQRAIPDDSPAARPAVEVAIEGPTQSFRRWLLADDPQRNRLLSFIGTWRYQAVADASARDTVFAQFERELTREPKVVIARADGSAPRDIAATRGREDKLDELGCRVKVLNFFPDYALDEKSQKPVSRSEQNNNPAAEVQIEKDGTKETRWVFAKFPDFKSKEARLPYRVTLDCPLAAGGKTPDFVIVAVGGGAHEVWKRVEGKTSSQTAAPDERIAVPGSPYTFRLAQSVPRARLSEEYAAAEQKGTVAALLIEVNEPTGNKTPLWLEAGKPRAVQTKAGIIEVSFGLRGAAAPVHPPPSGKPAHGGSPPIGR